MPPQFPDRRQVRMIRKFKLICISWQFKKLFFSSESDTERSLSPKACRSALFIMLYRGYPMMEMPFQLLNSLLEIDNQLGNWRYRHINMVRRTIGTRIGTGGSTGAGYLQGAMEKHYIFREISQLTSFLIDRRKLPQLPQTVADKLGYNFWSTDIFSWPPIYPCFPALLYKLLGREWLFF